jgi:outer membrane receptor protein involved in Fe transport
MCVERIARRSAFVCLLLRLSFTLAVSAQTLTSGTIRGQVVDSARAAISGVQIELNNEMTGIHRETQTDGTGYFTLAGLPLTGSYKLTASRSGFASEERQNLELRAGESATVSVTLSPAAAESEMTIFGTVEGVRSDAPQLGTRLDLKKIDDTPVLGRKITSLPLLDSAVRPARGTGDLFLNNTLFVINGGGRRQTSFTIDGSSGDDSWGRQTIFTNLPMSAVQELTVLTNSFSAEYGRSAGGVVNVVTKTGTNEFRGDVLYMWRPGGIEAANPLASQRTEDVLHQVAGAVSGPIVRNHSHFFFAGEYNHQNRDSTITSPLAPGIFTGEYRQGLIQARFDDQLTEHHTLSGRLNLDSFHDTNPADAVGGLALPSTARTFDRRAYGVQVSETALIGALMVNEVRAQFQIASPVTQFDPVSPSPQLSRPGVSTEGESRIADLINRQFQFADTLSVTRGSHYLKLGGDAIHSRSGGYGQEFGTGFVLGQFTFRTGMSPSIPTSALMIAEVARFTQSFGIPTYTVSEWLWSLFAQDSWRLRPGLTLDLGLRYERQNYSDDTNNFSPRIGFAYNLLGDSRSVIRGGYGIYYSELRANLEAGFALNGPAGVLTFTAQPGQLGFPTSIAPLPAFPPGAPLPPRDIIIRPGRRGYYQQFFDVSKLKGYPDQLVNPYTQQANLGFERELSRGWFLSVDYIYQHTIGIDRNLDLNAPAPFNRTRPGQVRTAAAADATRPIVPVPNGFRRIQATVNNGSSVYNGLQVNLSKRFGGNFSLLASYTHARILNTVEPDAPGGDPNEAGQIGIAERGHSLLEQPDRAVISGSWLLPLHFIVGGVVSLASARRFNMVTGADNNGDGANTDRPVINGIVVRRNAGIGTPVYDVSIFAQHEFVFSDRLRFSVRGEAFNLFNHSNIVGRNGTYGNADNGVPLATFGQPLGGISSVDPGREFQFLFRLRF